MEELFIRLFNISITASWLILAVVALRFLLKKSPKWIMGILWSFVAIRLICPFSFESALSIIPSVEPIPQDILTVQTPTTTNALPDKFISAMPTQGFDNAANTVRLITFAACAVWIAGMLALLIYMFISYHRIHCKTREAVRLYENVNLCDNISSAFILGVFKPQIYLPSSINKSDMPYVLAHEMAHLQRKDHLFKPFAFLLLCVYWFNPIIWVAYVFLCKDIELACDEKVIRNRGLQIKKPYSDALINSSVSHRAISACPLAFGDVNVKERVKTVLNYKKPTVRIVGVAVAACVITAVCLMTNPKTDPVPINENSGISVSQTNMGTKKSESDILKNKKAKLEKEISRLEEQQKAETEAFNKKLARFEKDIAALTQAEQYDDAEILQKEKDDFERNASATEKEREEQLKAFEKIKIHLENEISETEEREKQQAEAEKAKQTASKNAKSVIN